MYRVKRPVPSDHQWLTSDWYKLYSYRHGGLATFGSIPIASAISAYLSSHGWMPAYTRVERWTAPAHKPSATDHTWGRMDVKCDLDAFWLHPAAMMSIEHPRCSGYLQNCVYATCCTLGIAKASYASNSIRGWLQCYPIGCMALWHTNSETVWDWEIGGCPM